MLMIKIMHLKQRTTKKTRCKKAKTKIKVIHINFKTRKLTVKLTCPTPFQNFTIVIYT